MRKLLISTVVSLACVAPAMAQDAQTPAGSPAPQDQTVVQKPVAPATPQNQTTAAPNADQQPDTDATHLLENALRTRLARAGFTGIEMLPTSFLVRAKDADGNPVLLMLAPDSVADRQIGAQGGRDDDTGFGPPVDEEQF